MESFERRSECGTAAARRLAVAAALALVVAAVGLAAPAAASVVGYGDIRGHDRAELRRRFLAEYPQGYRVAGFHASALFHFRYAGVYYLRRQGGVNVDSGVAIFRRAGSRWLPLRHPSAAIEKNLSPVEYLYSASLGGGGEFTLIESSGTDEPASASSTKTDIQLTMKGEFGAGREKLDLVDGAEEPEPEGPASLLGGNGSSQQTDAADPSQDHSCSFHLGKPDVEPELAIGWHGEEMTVDLNLGDPSSVGGSSECGGAPEDPDGEEPWIEVRTEVRSPLGKPFSVPIVLNHSKREDSHDEETGALTGVYERTLTLKGSLDFKLLTVLPPLLN